MVDPSAELYDVGTLVSDRLGRYANADDGWFDANVQFWSEPDGVRLATSELSDLGAQVVDWVLAGSIEIPARIFHELEGLLVGGFGTDRGSLERGFCLEFLVGLDAALLSRSKTNLAEGQIVERTLSELMGDETKTAWVLVRSSG